MKKRMILSFLVLFFMSGLMAQNSGLGFNFQAVARNADGSVKSEQNLNLEVIIYANDQLGDPVYFEKATVLTDKFGVFSLIIGHGTYQSGTVDKFENISFREINAWLGVNLIENGSSVELVQAPLLSVPYAESAIEADNGLPIGAIIPYAGETENNDEPIEVFGCKGVWRLCNGTGFDPAEYPLLAGILGNAWGTNLLPDLRGVFLRGTNYDSDDSFADPDAGDRINRHVGGINGNHVGSFQMDEIKSHTHEYWDTHNPNTERVDDPDDQTVSCDDQEDEKKTTIPEEDQKPETRSKNANVNFIIRVK